MITAKIRLYTVADKAACLSLFDSNTPLFFDPSERPLFDEFLDAPVGEYFVMEADGEIVGCGGFFREDGDVARFSWGMLDRSQHGAGLGRMLSEHRLTAISKNGSYRMVKLSTTPMIAPFFEHMGLTRTGFEKDGFAPGMDKVLLELQLS